MHPSFSLSVFGFLLLGTSCLLSAKELDGVRAAAAGPCPTVDEAIAKMTVPDGYAVRCFASEPMIISKSTMSLIFSMLNLEVMISKSGKTTCIYSLSYCLNPKNLRVQAL